MLYRSFVTRNAMALSWATFLTALLLFTSAALVSGQTDRDRDYHRAVAARWEARQIAKGVLGPEPKPRPSWRFAPWSEALREWDHATFLRINSGWGNPFFDRVMPVVTHLGDGSVQAIGLLAYFAWACRRRRIACHRAAVLGLVGLALSAAAPLLKFAMPRYRPPSLYPYDVVLLVHPLYGGSFPSGHSFATFCVATILARCHPWITPWAYGLAALVGLSRICVGVHWPLDVIAGATLGTACGWLVTYVWNRRSAGADEQVRTEAVRPRRLADVA